jgi:hypothetical protein
MAPSVPLSAQEQDKPPSSPTLPAPMPPRKQRSFLARVKRRLQTWVSGVLSLLLPHALWLRVSAWVTPSKKQAGCAPAFVHRHRMCEI